jgi:hypothetical protein
VNAVAYDPINENVYYMGAPQGGVWKTTDGGLTWQPLTDYWQFLQVACIAVHPTNPNILYVGTGDFQGWMRPFSQGIMKLHRRRTNMATARRNRIWQPLRVGHPD